MRRGGRRGQFSSTNLSGLRDTVRRKLFDPNAEPVIPSAASLLAKLKPIQFKPIKLATLFKYSADSDEKHIQKDEINILDDEADSSTMLRIGSPEFLASAFRTDCLLGYIFRYGPDYHKFKKQEEGISMAALADTHSKTDSQKENEALSNFSPLHLLLDHENIDRWKSQKLLMQRYNPARWYPKELVQMIKMSTGKGKRTKKVKKKAIMLEQREEMDMENTETAVERAELLLEIKQTASDEEEDALESDNEDDDPEDARWNGKKTKKSTTPGEISDVDEDEEEEEENDYCQDYFDNGEGDDAFDNIRMDDGEGDVEDYYD
ncbi:hypothetical protein Ciccas_006020 [Cichlidogyrus casuarinus]|uniref:DNA-directed RNA polymerase III subunit n=1 Tax=Cichlidogyrus casuarinus TaxID=1844966 RepID=A0ABD2Q731_9PLAT